jgi:hypothetical protein
MQHWEVNGSGTVQSLCTDGNYFEIHTVPRQHDSEPSYVVFHHEYDNFMDKVGDVIGIFHSKDVMNARVWSRLRCQALRADKELELFTAVRQDVLKMLHSLEKEQDRYKIYND